MEAKSPYHPNLLLLYSFNDEDVSGSNLLDGKQNDKGTFDLGVITGTAAQAYNIDGRPEVFDFPNSGNNAYISMGQTLCPLMNSTYSISFWIYTRTLDQRRNPWGQDYAGVGSMTLEPAGSMSYYYGTSGNRGPTYQGFGSGNGTVTTGSWHHMVLVRDLDNMLLKWYVNGVKTAETTASYSSSAVGTNYNMHIGIDYTGYGLNGYMDNFRIFDIALTDADVISLYSEVEILYTRWVASGKVKDVNLQNAFGRKVIVWNKNNDTIVGTGETDVNGEFNLDGPAPNDNSFTNMAVIIYPDPSEQKQPRIFDNLTPTIIQG